MQGKKQKPYLIAIRKKDNIMPKKPGLYANIHAKRKRIKRQKAAGKTPEKMRRAGQKGRPTTAAFKAAAKTAKKSK
jgi:hypothetical protein